MPVSLAAKKPLRRRLKPKVPEMGLVVACTMKIGTWSASYGVASSSARWIILWACWVIADFSAADSDAEIYTTPEDSPELQFAKNFSNLSGNFMFCEKKEDFVKYLVEKTLAPRQWDS